MRMKDKGRAMSGIVRASAWLVAGAWMLGAACAVAQGTKIGFVNTTRIENESPQFVRAIEALKKEFQPREQQILELQKQIAAEQARFEKERDKLPPAEQQSRRNAIANMMRKSDQLAIALAEDVDRRKIERSSKLYEEATAIIKSIAEAGKFDLILQQVTYARPGIDITDQVLKEMAKRAGKP
jgi:outer membrane protein